MEESSISYKGLQYKLGSVVEILEEPFRGLKGTITGLDDNFAPIVNVRINSLNTLSIPIDYIRVLSDGPFFILSTQRRKLLNIAKITEDTPMDDVDLKGHYQVFFPDSSVPACLTYINGYPAIVDPCKDTLIRILPIEDLSIKINELELDPELTSSIIEKLGRSL